MDQTQTMSDYKSLAREIRKDVLALVHKGQTSHIASNFSLVDIATVLYENLKPEDEVIWSKGWASALYYVLNIRKGNLDREEVFNTFPNEPYGALLEPPHQPVPTGSCGHGLPVAVGMAYAKKLSGEPGIVYCIMSDGELNEGTSWEASLLASKLNLDNLIVLIDKNGWQAMGRTDEILPSVFPNWTTHDKFPGWYGRGCDGHNHELMADFILNEPKRLKEAGCPPQPIYFMLETIKGKGVKMFENKILYHYKHIDKETYVKALKELE